ncbi:VirK family protein [Bradyrhizobium sp. 145]|uniref:VirK family protein n=1 Tax=Bradyrhizobium sp. 145 TaxID=2782621 RepID=UPI001FFBC059|nr:VirK family protein [Bradyrhizobium sp. 145]
MASPARPQGGLIIKVFRVTAQNGISFSNAHQTVDSSGYPVTEYIRHTSAAKASSRCAPQSWWPGRPRS